MDVLALMLVLHRLRPTGLLFHRAVKMPQWFLKKKKKHDKKLYVTISENAAFF